MFPLLRSLLAALCLLPLALPAQLITTDPAAPVTDQPVTLTFDAALGNAGLADCDCAVYIHTGVITENSTSPSDWRYVRTVWGQANPDWQLTPVPGQPNRYTYTFGPSVREYFGVPPGEEIRRLAFVFRDASGNRAGRRADGGDIFFDVTEADAPLAVTLAASPPADPVPLGLSFPVRAGATRTAQLRLLSGGAVIAETTGTELTTTVAFREAGPQTLRFEAIADGDTTVTERNFRASFQLGLIQPDQQLLLADPGEEVQLWATSYVDAPLTLSSNRSGEIARSERAILLLDTLLPTGVPDVTYTFTGVYRGDTARLSVTYILGPPTEADPPAGFAPGATVLPDGGGVLFQLRAPGKDDVFLVGDFNDWTPTAATRLRRSKNGATFWTILPDLDPGQDHLYQYLVDLDNRQPDPYSTLVLDPDNDPFIGQETFAAIPPYPTGKTAGIVSWLRPADDYAWRSPRDYPRPDPRQMVVYELLLRDFLADHSFRSLTDTLDYLQRLGVNTIELMPVSEFEGNISWGYNVSFHMALDKYYGPPEDLKALVDACHERGLAVVLDVVYNHAFGQSPLVRLWGTENNTPTADNPYANRRARHPFNVGFDLDHENPLTKEYVKTTTAYWVEEFRIDGFRFDLSKGFTQNDTGNDVGAWNRYDAGRIATIKDYADHLWSVDPATYVILEHLAESREENELANHGRGMYFWSGFNPHDEYLEASMGYASNLNSVLPERRGFDGPNLLAYMESHDEERMQYRNETNGNRAGDYNVRDLATGLDRIKLASTFFYTIPGPKMLWQFGELGYDFPINYCPDGRIDNGCRTDPKPIRWDYREDSLRQGLYNHIADLLWLRNNFDGITAGPVTASSLINPTKYVHLTAGELDVAVFGNFDVVPRTMRNTVPYPTTWYDYFSGEAVRVNTPNQEVPLAPGEFHVYLSRPITPGGGELTTGLNQAAVRRLGFRLGPNPSAGRVRLAFEQPAPGPVTVDVLDPAGRRLRTLFRGQLPGGPRVLEESLTGLPAGLYWVRLTSGGERALRPLVLSPR